MEEMDEVEDVKEVTIEPTEIYVPQAQWNDEIMLPDIPTKVTCQNCDATFPSKYQYYRHECEFNVEKFVLKPNVDASAIDQGLRIKFACPTCGKEFMTQRNVDRHVASHTNKNECPYCKKQYASASSLRFHKRKHCKNAEELRNKICVWKCLSCCQVFPTLASGTKHEENCDKIITSDQIKREAIPSTSQVVPDALVSVSENVQKIPVKVLMQCEFCNRIYADKEKLLTHQKMHTTNVNYECVCKATFESYMNASNHWLICSDDAKLFPLPTLTYCEFCDQTYKSHKRLYVHKSQKGHYTQKMHMSKPKIKAELCEEKRSRTEEEPIIKLINEVLAAIKSSLIQENNEVMKEACVDEKNAEDLPSSSGSQAKQGEKNQDQKETLSKQEPVVTDTGYVFQCEKCPMVWGNVADLENHRQSAHNKKFVCNVCREVYQTSRDLLVHKGSHPNLNPFKCEICKRRYLYQSHLTEHMRFHQGVKLFGCSYKGCDARYRRRPDLRDHIRKVHTRKRPYKCAYCTKCFLTDASYQQHRVVHTNDRRYQCDICQRKFFRNATMKNHRRIHTNERPFLCHLCGRDFRQKGDCYTHIRKMHSDENE